MTWRVVARRLARAIASLVLAAAAFTLLAATVLPRIFDYRTMTMLSGSMSPDVPTGSVIVDTQEPTKNLAVGDIITYQIPVEDHRVETHRVAWVGRDKDGAVLIRTRGDRNPADDPWTARIEAPTVWHVSFVIPVVGRVINALRSVMLQRVLSFGLPLTLVVWLLYKIWRPRRAEPDPGSLHTSDEPRDDGPRSYEDSGELDEILASDEDAAALVGSE